jgi:two-component system, cell cycle sensor histidine kinase and response regulator CckA
VIGAHLSWTWANEVKQSIETSVANDSVEVLILSRDNTILLGSPASQGQPLSLDAPSTYTTALARTQGYRDYPGLGWSVLVRQPTTIALAPARSLQFQVFLYGMGLGLLFARWSWLRSRRIVQPLQQLTTAADHISQGDRHRQIPHLNRQDEISQLAQAFEQMMQTLNTQADQLREQAALLEIATDAIFVRSLDSTLLFWNHGAARIYGWTATEAIGQNIHRLLNPEKTVDLQTAETVVLKTGEWRGELEKTTKAGKTIIVESRWALARDQDGHAQFILTVDTDITEKKQLEAQFLRAQRLENLGALAGGIAHDMNNILTPIIASAKLLQVKSLNQSDFHNRMLTILLDSSQRGANLVQQILSFARGTTGERTSVQLKHLLREVIQVLQSTFPKNIEISLDLPAELWTMDADSTQLHQVLMNLCVNARDAMPKGGALKLSASNICLQADSLPRHPDAKAGNYVMLWVMDTGEGISPEALDHIFEPFYTTKEIGKGTGLGLSTVLGIIKSHNGFIDIQSEVGQGTRFTLYLPAEAVPVSNVRLMEAPLPYGLNEWILIVDDETSILEVIKLSLEAHRYQVMTATNGIDALLMYQEHHAQLQVVLIDLMMPELDGLQTIAALKTINPHLKIIATSGLLKEEMLDAEVSAFLPKPYTLEHLLQTLHTVLQVQALNAQR